MGLTNYNEQKAAIQESDEVIEFLGFYAGTMNRYIIDLESLWSTNADQYYILLAISCCVDIASDIEYDYSTFSANAIKWLNSMDALEKIVKTIIPGKKLKRKTNTPTVSTIKSRVKVDPKVLENYAEKIKAFDKMFSNAQVKTAGINAKVDKLILEKFTQKYSLSYINKRIKRLQEINLELSNALYMMVRNYRDTENKLNSVAGAIVLGGESSGAVDSTIMKSYSEKRGNVTDGKWPEMKSYSIELGTVSNMEDPEQIRQYIEDRNRGLKTQGDNLKSHCTRHTSEKLATIGITAKVSDCGNGNTWYQNLKNRRWSSEIEVHAEAYDGNLLWENIASGNVKEPIYNIVISYSKAGDPYGHVLMIDAIVDGKICYSDNYDSTGRNGGRRGSAQVVTIAEFRNLYSRQGYVQQGAIHFTA